MSKLALVDYDEYEPDPWETKVYIVYDTETLTSKIGVALDPERRLSQLRTANPRLKMYPWTHRSFGSDDPSYIRRVERLAHSFLDEYNVGGEWFAVPPSIAETAVYLAAQVVQSVIDAHQLMIEELKKMEGES